MRIFEQGVGEPIVLIPGVQGRWEYLRAAVDALSSFFRVITFSLGGDAGSDTDFDAARGLDAYVDQVSAALDRLRVERAVVCGVSFGALIAVRFAARHPDRTSSLVLVSPVPPGWRPLPRHRLYMRVPWILGPLFLVETPFRFRAEMAAAFTDRHARRRFVRSQLSLLGTARLSLRDMARRGRLMPTAGIDADAGRVAAPTLVVTGETSLDHIISVSASLQYLALIPGANHVQIERTGHLGSITRPDRFAVIVRDFVEHHRHAAA